MKQDVKLFSTLLLAWKVFPVIARQQLLPNSYSGKYQLDCNCGGQHIGETKKAAWQENGNHQVLWKTQNLVTDCFIGCILTKLKTL